MPAQQASVSTCDPAAIGIVPVPDHWPPDPGSAVSEFPGGWAEPPTAPLGASAAPAAAVQTPPAQFAVLLAETLTGVRPVRHVLPWLSERVIARLNRLLPLFQTQHRPRVRRVLTTQPAPGVIEMTLIITLGPRTRALAVRLERNAAVKPARQWLCTAIEAA